ncbi:MAG: hypothetical protein WBY53_06770 [Acidobacteriaceae bacterium]
MKVSREAGAFMDTPFQPGTELLPKLAEAKLIEQPEGREERQDASNR